MTDPLFAGPGAVRAACRTLDWTASPLGTADRWARELRLAIALCFDSAFPMCVYGGSELAMVFNDAFISILGSAWPQALGKPGQSVWGKTWQDIEPQLSHVRHGGAAIWREDALFDLERAGVDEAFFTYAMSPVHDHRGEVVAVHVVAFETTERVQLVRALDVERARFDTLLRQLPAHIAVLRGPEHVFELANDAYREFAGQRPVMGRPMREALPDLAAQGFADLLDQVLATGETFVGRDVPVRIGDNGGTQERYFDFVYQALADTEMSRSGIFVYGVDVTDAVNAQRAVGRLLAEADHRQAALELQQVELEAANQRLQENTLELELLAAELQRSSSQLEQRSEAAEADARRARLIGDIGGAITSDDALPEMMRRCCEAVVAHFDADFARIWFLDEDAQALVLRASAGPEAHLEDEQQRIPVGEYKIGQIAAERTPYTVTVAEPVGFPGPRTSGPRQVVSFAGYPLVVGDELLGVFAMSAHCALDDADLQGLATAATAVSVALSNARHLEQAVRARQIAEDANRSKMEFLAVMSHELRTPLNAIRGYTDLIDMEIRGPVTLAQRTDLERIRRSQQHLLGLIEQVLTHARVETGRVTYDLTSVSLCESLAATDALIVLQAQAKGLRYTRIECDPTLRGRADREKLEQIVLNLLTNAVKFTAPGGAVSVACTVDGSTVTIAVQDTGIGIPADKLTSVFEPFVQVDQRLSRTNDGIGLGLAISRELARGMGGDVSAISEPGAGSTFAVTIPRA